jgi:hypothetical protein
LVTYIARDVSEGLPLRWLGFTLAYLAFPVLAVDPKSQISSTCKLGRYTSKARIIQIAK